jgi:hypothetical protein
MSAKKKQSVLENGIDKCEVIGNKCFDVFEKTEDMGVAKTAIAAFKSCFQGISLLAQAKRLTGKPGDLTPYTGE